MGFPTNVGRGCVSGGGKNGPERLCLDPSLIPDHDVVCNGAEDHFVAPRVRVEGEMIVVEA